MKISEEKNYEALSPFELKNKLIQMAETHHEKMMLNAGRGNPNWVATIPRQAFSQLNLFAVEESKRIIDLPNLGSIPEKKGIAKRLETYLSAHPDAPGIEFLRHAFSYAYDELNCNPDDFVGEMVDATLGDHYPEPDRMLLHSEKVVRHYLGQEMSGNKDAFNHIDLFATEGGTAAMDYIFTALMENKLLKKGDKIALGAPIFTPYLEIPRLNDFEFIELEIKQDENEDWQYPDSEIEKLTDPDVKAFFLVNPSNPTSVSMQKKTLDKIGELVKTQRKDLILLTDDVYGTFVNGFRSLIDVAPNNTIFVYSFSKYFGATGLRLGIIGLHENNVFDKTIAAFPDETRSALCKRYNTITLNPNKMKLIDRMVADSRLVALHHTAGLSTFQQVLMVLFSLMCLTDKKNEYKKEVQSIVRNRFKTLYDAIGIQYPENEYDAHYYTTIDIVSLAEMRYSKAFSDYLIHHFEPIDFVMRLAEEKSIVLMDGGGFDAPNMSVRVSLANLPNSQYGAIGKGISDLLEEYYQHWQTKKG